MAEHVCPSGLRLELRGMKGKELRLFEDRKSIKDGSILDSVLSACVLRMLDPGPYNPDIFGESGAPDWKRVLLGDEFSTFIAVRKLTFGDEYNFKVQCSNRGCKERFEWSLKLSDLPVRALSAESAAAGAASGQPLSADIAGGVKFRLLTGEDERALFKTKKAENPLVSNLALSIVELAGEKDKSKIRRALEEMDLGPLEDLRKRLDESDCGVEIAVEVECPECGNVWETPLPLGPGFLLRKSG